jgi:hypothetical protein
MVYQPDNEPSPYWLDGRWNGGDFENGIYGIVVYRGEKFYI